MASEPVVLHDDFGDPIEVEADPMAAPMPDGTVSPAGAILITCRAGGELSGMRLSGERLTAFLEAVIRASRPRQMAACAEAAPQLPCAGCGDQVCAADAGLMAREQATG